ncbi:hypothetical protein D9756_011065 [Leucocoprinus leucothites]|uniref:F-box domain-containing protein n=1 Tax=Leucocoprinus leucothites TaxID=201217 RepID=A0A8H5CPQ4_9AGAR|nr:hypothetical protein D9756_011065 [Leucoagaricus leucothites]
MPLSLPPEIWLKIASFIPADELHRSKLYSVNRTLLWYYLEARYSHLHIDYSLRSNVLGDVMKSIQNLHVLNSPFMAPAGITKELELTFCDQLPSKLALRLVSGIKATLQRKPGLIPAEQRDTTDTAPPFPPLSTIAHRLSQFTSLTTIKCNLSSAYSNPHIIPLRSILVSGVSAAWKSSQSTLTSLTINIYAPCVPKLGLSDIVFPHLQSFSLSVGSDWSPQPLDGDSFDKANKALASFFTAHRSTLTSLTLISKSRPESRSLLTNIPHLPHLNSLTFHFDCYQQAEIVHPMIQLLELHSEQLESLGLHLTMHHAEAMSRWHATPEPVDGCLSDLPGWSPSGCRLMDIVLPKMECLAINVTEFHIMRALITKHIPQVSLRLSPPLARTINDLLFYLKLKILKVERLINNQNAESLLDAISASSCSELRSLEMQVNGFDARLLQHLSRSLPTLNTLELQYYSLDSRAWPGLDERQEVLKAAIEQFAPTPPCAAWALENISLKRYTELKNEPRELRSALVGALPNVKIINGWRRDEFVDEGRISWKR